MFDSIKSKYVSCLKVFVQKLFQNAFKVLSYKSRGEVGLIYCVLQSGVFYH